jgi:hypothetical protein
MVAIRMAPLLQILTFIRLAVAELKYLEVRERAL